jgi:hypothetical protein
MEVGLSGLKENGFELVMTNGGSTVRIFRGFVEEGGEIIWRFEIIGDRHQSIFNILTDELRTLTLGRILRSTLLIPGKGLDLQGIRMLRTMGFTPLVDSLLKKYGISIPEPDGDSGPSGPKGPEDAALDTRMIVLILTEKPQAQAVIQLYPSAQKRTEEKVVSASDLIPPRPSTPRTFSFRIPVHEMANLPSEGEGIPFDILELWKKWIPALREKISAINQEFQIQTPNGPVKIQVRKEIIPEDNTRIVVQGPNVSVSLQWNKVRLLVRIDEENVSHLAYPEKLRKLREQALRFLKAIRFLPEGEPGIPLPKEKEDVGEETLHQILQKQVMSLLVAVGFFSATGISDKKQEKEERQAATTPAELRTASAETKSRSEIRSLSDLKMADSSSLWPYHPDNWYFGEPKIVSSLLEAVKRLLLLANLRRDANEIRQLFSLLNRIIQEQEAGPEIEEKIKQSLELAAPQFSIQEIPFLVYEYEERKEKTLSNKTEEWGPKLERVFLREHDSRIHRPEIRKFKKISTEILDEILDGIIPYAVYGTPTFGIIYAILFNSRIQSLDTVPFNIREEKLAETEAQGGAFDKIRLMNLLQTKDNAFALIAIPVPASISPENFHKILQDLNLSLKNHPRKPLVFTYGGHLPQGFGDEIFREFHERVFI